MEKELVGRSWWANLLRPVWGNQVARLILQHDTIGIIDPESVMLPVAQEALACHRRNDLPTARDITGDTHAMYQSQRGPDRRIAAQDETIGASSAQNSFHAAPIGFNTCR